MTMTKVAGPAPEIATGEIHLKLHALHLEGLLTGRRIADVSSDREVVRFWIRSLRAVAKWQKELEAMFAGDKPRSRDGLKLSHSYEDGEMRTLLSYCLAFYKPEEKGKLYCPELEKIAKHLVRFEVGSHASGELHKKSVDLFEFIAQGTYLSQMHPRPGF